MAFNVMATRPTAKLNFIVPRHANDFDKDVLNGYYEQAENGIGFWGVVPSVDMGVARQTRPEHTLAGFMAVQHDDKNYYHDMTEGKMIPDFENIWASANLEKIFEAHPDVAANLYMQLVIDTKAVLDYHGMFHAIRLDAGEYGGTGLQGFSHFPINAVW